MIQILAIRTTLHFSYKTFAVLNVTATDCLPNGKHQDLGRWNVELGLRWTHVAMDADQVDALMARMRPPLRGLRDDFNASDRSQDDDLIDFVAVVSYSLSDTMGIEAGIARKNRAPSHQERYLWLPLESTAGLADGNLYIGDVNLDSETAWQFELGFGWHTDIVDFTPRIFYHHVDDYIQGVAATDPRVIMIATMNGDATPLRFANVDARLWGPRYRVGCGTNAALAAQRYF